MSDKSTIRTLSFRSLLNQVFRFRQGLAQVLVLYVIWSFSELAIPFLTKILVDQGVGYEDINIVVIVLLAQIMFILGSVSTDFFKSWIMRHIGVRMNMKIVNAYVQKIFQKELLFFNNTDEGILLQHVNDNLRIEQFLTTGALSLLNAFFKLSLFSVILIFFSFKVSLIFFGSVIVLILYDISFRKRRKEFDQHQFEASSRVRKRLLEIAQGIFDIKVNNLEAHHQKKWNNLQNELSVVRIKLLGIGQFYKGGTLMITTLRNAIILFLTCYMVINGQLTIGALLAIQYILGQSGQPSIDIMQFIRDYEDAKYSLERLKSIFTTEKSNLKSEITQISHEGLRLENLTFRYPESDKGVFDIDLTIDKGQKIAVIGESGSGKTTMLKLLLGLYEPEKGKVLYGNYPEYLVFTDQWRQQCSVLTQEGFVFEGDVLYNITFEKNMEKVDEKKLNQAIEISCFSSVLKRLTKGLQTPVSQSGKNLSKGQMQRLVLARALYKNGNYIILDEPTNSLDNKTASKVIQNLIEFYPEKNIIFSTHKLHLTLKMDFIILMDDGKIIDSGTPFEIMNKQKDLYQTYQMN